MPIDFSALSQPNIMGDFTQTLGQLQQVAAMRQKQEEAQAQQAQAVEMRRRVADWRANPTPDATQALMTDFPDMVQPMTAAMKVKGDAEKADLTDFASRALTLSLNGMGDRAKELVKERIAALQASGKADEAKAMQDNLRIYELDPKAGEAMLGLVIHSASPETYKAVFGEAGNTGFQRDLIAAGIDPNSAEGKAAAQQYVQLKIDPLVEMEAPGGGKFVGLRSDYFKRYGGGAPAPAAIAMPSNKAAYDALPAGSTYRAPDGSIKVKGGATTQNTPAPELGANGLPAVLTQAQYQATVNARGKAATDDWMRRNNITLGGR